jgi:chromosome partitioning protein
MSQHSEAAPPPYFNITPDSALAELDPAVGTADFAAIAAHLARGRDDLLSRGHAEDGRKTLRRFSTWEITKYLIPVAPAYFRRVLRANAALPQGLSETEGGAKWFTLDEVLRLRAHFAAEGSRAKEYRPWRPEGLPAKIAAIANFKGGVGKTSTAAHLAMSAALDGYRVLVIDLDSQGSMTSIFGGQVADEWGTVFPLIARDYALGLQAENRRRVDRGDTPLPFEDMLEAALEKTARDVIQPTHWPNIDLIGAQLNLYWAEFQIPVWRMALRGWKLWEALSGALERDGVLADYDVVILDTPPALGYLTINGLAAADILLVPLGASFLEFDSTGRFFDMLHSTFQSIEEGENLAARALGRPGTRFEWDAVRAVITRYDGAQQAEHARLIQA